MRVFRNLRTFVPIAAVLCALAVVGPTDRASATTFQPVKILNFDFCQFAGNGASFNCSNTAAKKAALESMINSTRPQVITLQEICDSTAASIISDINNDGVTNLQTWHATANEQSDSRCGQSDPIFGDVVLSVYPVSGWLVYGVDGPTTVVMCASLEDGMDLHVCTTNLDNTEAGYDRAAEDALVASHAVNYGASDKPTIITGAFTNIPSSANLNPIYANDDGATGEFAEIDQCTSPNQRSTTTPGTCNHYTHASAGAGTGLNQKYDYTFIRAKYFKNPQNYTVTTSPYSDHAMTVGSITECSDAAC